jgi:hypothetical protein
MHSSSTSTMRRELQRVQSLRRLLDADHDLSCPSTSAGLRHAQVKRPTASHCHLTLPTQQR